ncbi:MAG: hypothetical protein A2694_02250 [Candidatus Blackburnbacteria bacterium RIFCSPHIGHO2_01_FULL_40_17]|uniref:Bacterial sugar transferase domain-containing protein n=1 Tax=Candidatus Blackburnbacteria bacterium RIFCSPLOWO2_01_FULL_40_20 TaxID=1797519 RepID=A0A1G1VF00_9BACT|nr:MAG: hypothetical protein A2694_02250 [Candidatus Blackburnbacteria bacterium RIFCSPHIGHO2_01_FULL_40_17]OGY14010.1 MAG: hypothetical protein A3A77_03375 [Candidatus Blackburnbacteria bacterium RIFCSPLOWO2_01_FULL_40_20]OGY15703.1 MAG: hypothetical protein A3I52_01410 [Candidatus Blackburnbacteria bacterium RIFCSPLOWO2_02_FULL_40_10]
MPRIKKGLKNNKLYTVFLLVAFDTLAVFLSVFASYYIRNDILGLLLSEIQPVEVYIKVFPFILILILFLFAISDLYSPKSNGNIFESYKLLRAQLIWIVILMSGAYIYKFNYSRLLVLFLLILSPLFLLIGRSLVYFLIFRFQGYFKPKANVIVVGYDQYSKRVATFLLESQEADYNFLGFVARTKSKGRKIIGYTNSFPRLISKFSVDEIFVTDKKMSKEEVLGMVVACWGEEVQFKLSSNLFDLVTGGVNVGYFNDFSFVNLERVGFNLWQKIYKRIVDIIISLPSFIFTLPFWGIISLAVKLDSNGPTLIKQKRVGAEGKVFEMYKFRTMKKETSLYRSSPKSKKDGRVTRVGGFLRRTSLDELPQLINVIKGEMSLVGPRPEMPYVVKKYKEWEKIRLMVKPGLTGLWQVLGRKDLPLRENLEYDFYYVAHHSFLLDLVIIYKTIPLVVQGKGAY